METAPYLGKGMIRITYSNKRSVFTMSTYFYYTFPTIFFHIKNHLKWLNDITGHVMVFLFCFVFIYLKWQTWIQPKIQLEFFFYLHVTVSWQLTEECIIIFALKELKHKAFPAYLRETILQLHHEKVLKVMSISWKIDVHKTENAILWRLFCESYREI